MIKFVLLILYFIFSSYFRYKENLWTWNLDWSIHKTARPPKDEFDNSIPTHFEDEADIHNKIKSSINHLSEKRKLQLHMPGYPK